MPTETEHSGEHGLPLRERIARALWDFAYADGFPEPWPRDGEDREVAMASGDAVIEALGLQSVGTMWLQREDGKWAHQPVYRLPSVAWGCNICGSDNHEATHPLCRFTDAYIGRDLSQ